jgi:hypothetical protein
MLEVWGLRTPAGRWYQSKHGPKILDSEEAARYFAERHGLSIRLWEPMRWHDDAGELEAFVLEHHPEWMEEHLTAEGIIIRIHLKTTFKLSTTQLRELLHKLKLPLPRGEPC